jgi:hypothetical protein
MPMLPALLTLLLVLGLAAPAASAPDLASVTIDLETLRTSDAAGSLRAFVQVEGERIVDAKLTPAGAAAITLRLDGDVFVFEKTYTSEQELAAAFPDGEYLLTLNGSTEIRFDFARTPVPSPAITAPLPASILVPGPVTVEFTRCLACTGPGDATDARIYDDDNDEVLVIETLAPDAESWTPSDGVDPFELPEDGSFFAVVMHAALREVALVGANSDDFVLFTGVASSDAVPFFTGGAMPSGSFCIVAADDDATLDPLGECLAIDEPSAALIDPSGTYALSLPGVEIEYDMEVGANGAISGEARADLDGNGSFETTAPVRGKLAGFQGRVDRHVAFDFRSAAPAAKLAVRINEQASVEEGALGGSQRAKGKLMGEKVAADAPSTLPLGDEPIGWLLRVVLEGKRVEDASITLEDGRVFTLRGRFVHDFLTDLAKLDLRSEGEDEGVQVRFEGLVIEDLESQPPVFGGGDFTFRILGQRGRINPLP